MEKKNGTNGKDAQSPEQQIQLAKLFDDHRPWLVKMIRFRIDPKLAKRVAPEDIISGAFLLARRKWKKFLEDRPMSEKSWLYRMAMDCLFAEWNKHKREVRDVTREMQIPDRSSIQLGMDLIRKSLSPSQKAIRREEEMQFKQVLESLSQTDREVLIMHHNDQLNFVEIGEVLGITSNAATLRYAKAMLRLKTQWNKAYGKSN